MIADFIVVGGGSAGCAVARRLADGGHRVLLLEAGKSDRGARTRIPALVGGIVHNPEFDWCYRAEPDPVLGGPGYPWPAGKRLGGGSSINGMMYIRGHPNDYDQWARLGAEGWDYASVLPWFRRIEDNEGGADDWRGAGGPISVSECRSRYPVVDAWIAAATQAGITRSPDLNGALADGVDRVQLSQRAGLRYSSADGYLRGAPSNLEVRVESAVRRILIEDGRAVGVVVDRAGTEHEIRAQFGVALCAGALNTPRLLMLSGIGPGGHLAESGIATVRDLPGVGANLQEHVGTHLIQEIDGRSLNVDARGMRGFGQVLQFVFARRGALTTGIGHAQAMLRTRPGLPAPNIQLAMSAFAFDMAPSGNLELRRNAAFSTMIGLLHAKSRGTVRLAGSDPLAPPRIDHSLFGDDDDFDQLVEGVEMARRIVAQPALAPFAPREIRPGTAEDDRDGLRAIVRQSSVPLYHPAGTARMGAAEDPLAVVDPSLLVRGMAGLWVADASIMPVVVGANTNATCIMIGEKGASHILDAVS